MRRRALVIVVGLAVVGPPIAAQGPAPPAFATREAIRRMVGEPLPGRAHPLNDRSDWSAVRALAPGSEITLTAGAAPPAIRRFVIADETAVVVLRLPNPSIDPADASRLLQIARTQPERLSTGGASSEVFAGDVRIGPDGVYVGSRRVADVGQLIERVPRSDVAEIRGPRARKGSILGAALGAGGGFVLGLVSAVVVADRQCGHSCADEKALIGLSIVGLPVAGGLAGYYGFSHAQSPLIYQRVVN